MNWAKHDKEKNLNILLSLLKEHKEQTFKSLSEGLKVSNPTLTEYIKLLEEQGKIERFNKAGDRRNQWYRIKPESEEQVTKQLGKYEAIHFIEQIQNPIYNYKAEKGIAGAIFLSEPSDQKDRKMYEDIPKTVLNIPGLLKTIKFATRTLKSGTKMAVVLMIEKEPDKV